MLPQYYQALFRDGECFLHVVSLLNSNLDDANGEKLVLNVLKTLTCLLASNDASKVLIFLNLFIIFFVYLFIWSLVSSPSCIETMLYPMNLSYFLACFCLQFSNATFSSKFYFIKKLLLAAPIFFV